MERSALLTIPTGDMNIIRKRLKTLGKLPYLFYNKYCADRVLQSLFHFFFYITDRL